MTSPSRTSAEDRQRLADQPVGDVGAAVSLSVSVVDLAAERARRRRTGVGRGRAWAAVGYGSGGRGRADGPISLCARDHDPLDLARALRAVTVARRSVPWLARAARRTRRRRPAPEGWSDPEPVDPLHAARCCSSASRCCCSSLITLRGLPAVAGPRRADRARAARRREPVVRRPAHRAPPSCRPGRRRGTSRRKGRVAPVAAGDVLTAAERHAARQGDPPGRAAVAATSSPSSSAPPRASPAPFASRLHASLVAPARSILILVDPAARAARDRHRRRRAPHPHATTRSSSPSLQMQSSFAAGDLVGGLAAASQMLAEHATPPNTLHAGAERARVRAAYLRTRGRRRPLAPRFRRDGQPWASLAWRGEGAGHVGATLADVALRGRVGRRASRARRRPGRAAPGWPAAWGRCTPARSRRAGCPCSSHMVSAAARYFSTYGASTSSWPGAWKASTMLRWVSLGTSSRTIASSHASALASAVGRERRGRRRRAPGRRWCCRASSSSSIRSSSARPFAGQPGAAASSAGRCRPRGPSSVERAVEQPLEVGRAPASLCAAPAYARTNDSWWSLPGSAVVEQLAQALLPRSRAARRGCSGAE